MTTHASPPFWRSKVGLVCAGFLAIAGFFLITEHTAHVLGALPWLFLAACPLMHLFMHHGHGEHDHGAGGAADKHERGGNPSGEE
ncbi:MAG: DUF2933 domain-containing protein [Steroidobacteraceae bacterium]